jgi:hypothetical protein
MVEYSISLNMVHGRENIIDSGAERENEKKKLSVMLDRYTVRCDICIKA